MTQAKFISLLLQCLLWWVVAAVITASSISVSTNGHIVFAFNVNAFAGGS